MAWNLILSNMNIFLLAESFMKNLYIFLVLILVSTLSFGQIDKNEIMVLKKATTIIEMNAISNPDTASLIYNVEDKNVYVYDGANWIVPHGVHTPYITSRNVVKVSVTETKTVSFSGVHFEPSTTFTIPGFDGVINSVSVLSPTDIEINLTGGNTVGVFDIVVSNSGLANTSWINNGAGLLVIEGYNGTNQTTAGLSCKTILDNGFSTGDGTYWINPDGGSTSNSFEVFCDMTTDGGGWTRLEYSNDLSHTNHFGNTTDGRRWLPSNFSLNFTDTQINDIRNVSSEGKQTYVGTCDGVIHYRYQAANYGYAFGFRFQTGAETAFGQSTYPSSDIMVTADGCKTNNSVSTNTVFEVKDVRVPIINVYSRDNGASSEKFGSPLTQNHAWLR